MSAALGALPFSQDGFGPTLEDVRKGLIGKIGENMSFRRFKRFASGAKLATYLHGTRIGVVVEYDGDETAAKDVAMHVAAMKPVALSSADVPAELVARERSVAAAKAAKTPLPPRCRQAGAVAEIVAKRIEGGVQKYLKEVSLFDQSFREERQADRRADAQGRQHHRQGLHAVCGGRGHREEGRRLRRRGRRPGGLRRQSA
jgi:elongation factor Ts